MASDADDRKQQQPAPPQGQQRFPSDPERQQRELEELRRQFAEVGKRISAFEPASPDQQRERSLVLARSIAPPAKQPAPPRWRLVAAVALTFVLGTGFGYGVVAGGVQPPAAPASAVDGAATAQRPAPAAAAGGQRAAGLPGDDPQG